MSENSSRFFCNRDCAFFPCHDGADSERFNCIFCYCPLYTLGNQCGGGFRYLENGVKDCSACLLPHLPEGYDRILEKFPLLSELAKEEP